MYVLTFDYLNIIQTAFTQSTVSIQFYISTQYIYV